MLLYHFSNQNISDSLNVDKAFSNSFSSNSQALSPVKRLYFYTTPKPQEHFFYHAEYMYTVKIADKLIYNVDNDTLKLFKGDYTAFFKAVQRRGYVGILYTVNGYQCAAVFCDVKITKRIKKCLV